MSEKITGNAKLPESASIEIHGLPGRFEEVPVDTTGHINRDTDSKRIKKYLKQGWNWALFSPIIVAEFPSGKKLLLDGDHRRHMYRLTFPEATTIPSYVVEVNNMEEYHALFVKLNFDNRANITREEVFVHEVRANKPETVEINMQLIRCGVSIYGSSEPDGIVGYVPGHRVTVGAFKRTLKRGPEEAKKAIKILLDAWPTDEKLYGELMEAVAILHLLYPCLGDTSKIALDFENWFTNYLNINKQNVVAKKHKIIGGCVQNKHAESLARGLVTEFRTAQLRDGTAAKYKQNKLSLRVINNLID